MAFNITDFSNKWANFKEELARHINHALDKDGDTMNGSLLLSKNPTDNMEAATKLYVDNLLRFTPGDTLLTSFSLGSTGSATRMNVEGVVAPFNIYQDRAYGIRPSASGSLKVRCTIPTPNRGIPQWYHYYSNNGSETYMDLSDTKDMLVTYVLKYSCEGCEDIELWSIDNMSMFQASRDKTGVYKESGYSFETEIPVIKGKQGVFTLTQICKSFNYPYDTSHNIVNDYAITNVPLVGASLKIGMDNPVLNLNYTEV